MLYLAFVHNKICWFVDFFWLVNCYTQLMNQPIAKTRYTQNYYDSTQLAVALASFHNYFKECKETQHAKKKLFLPKFRLTYLKISKTQFFTRGLHKFTVFFPCVALSFSSPLANSLPSIIHSSSSNSYVNVL